MVDFLKKFPIIWQYHLLQQFDDNRSARFKRCRSEKLELLLYGLVEAPSTGFSTRDRKVSVFDGTLSGFSRPGPLETTLARCLSRFGACSFTTPRYDSVHVREHCIPLQGFALKFKNSQMLTVLF